MSEERWEVIPKYPDYRISTHGEIISLKRNKVLKPYDSGSVEIFNSEGSSTWTIYTLMACTFLNLDITDPFRNRVLFKDGDKKNIDLDNLYIEDTSDLPGEEWIPFKEYAGNALADYYMISNKGRVKEIKHTVDIIVKGKQTQRRCPEIIVKTNKCYNGYMQARLHRSEGKDINIMIHRAVAYNFCENDDPVKKSVVNHIDGDKTNNCSENLEWSTPRENIQHAIRTGLLNITKETFINRPLIRVETGDRYNSMSEASRAMGKWYGYISERVKLGRPCVDAKGETWTLKFIDSGKPKHKNLFNINP